jgi:hypothetical protein
MRMAERAPSRSTDVVTAVATHPNKSRARARWLAWLLVLSAVVALVPMPVHAAKVIPAVAELPFPILGTSGASTPQGVFLFGGRSNTSYQRTILHFSPLTGTVSTLAAQLPSGRQSTSAVYDGSRYIYVFGGAELEQTTLTFPNGSQTTAIVPRAVDDILRFDTQSLTITNLSASNPFAKLPAPAWGTSAVWDPQNNVAYIFGGIDFVYGSTATFNRLDTIWEFNPAGQGAAIVTDLSGAPATRASSSTDEWLPYQVQDAGAAVVGRTAYLSGGLATLCYNNANVEVSCSASDANASRTQYEPTTQITEFPLDAANRRAGAQATASAVLPVGLQFAPAVTNGSEIYIFGGRTPNGSASSQILRYLPSQGIVLPYSAGLPSVRFAFTATSDGHAVWILGGRDADVNANGLRDISEFIPGPTEPLAPTNVQYLGDGNGVHLAWGPPNYNGGAPVLGYNVYRTDPDGVIRNLTSTSQLDYRDLTSIPGRQYTYTVRAFNRIGESSGGGTVQVVAQPNKPGAPTGFQAFAGKSMVFLRWQPPADNGGSAILYYRIYKNGTLYLNNVKAVSYNDSAANNVWYNYSITAVSSAGEGPAARSAPVEPSSNIPPAPGGLALSPQPGNKVVLSWDQVPLATSYVVESATSLTALGTRTGTSATGTTATLSIPAGTRYYFDVYAAVSGNYLSPPSGVVKFAFVTPASTVQNLTGFYSTTGVLRLDWSPPASPGGADPLFYVVNRSANGGAPVTMVDSTVQWTATGFTDKNVTPGNYTYTVTPAAVADTGTPVWGSSATVGPVSVASASNKPPVAAVVATPTINPHRFQPIVVDASGSYDADDSVSQYSFNFGDGTTTGWVLSPIQNHTYYANGTYNLSVSVKDDRGAVSVRPAVLQIIVGLIRADNSSLQPSVGSGNPKGNASVGTKGFLGIPGPAAPEIVAVLASAALVMGIRRRSRR